jgi:hypothetical protein
MRRATYWTTDVGKGVTGKEKVTDGFIQKALPSFLMRCARRQSR